MSHPAASVVIGVYNRSRQIVPCLESLLASTFQDFEIVLIDDCSTDDSLAVLERFQAAHQDRRIRLLKNAKNLGAAGARNVGIDAAEGDWIFFVDSDCLVEPSWLDEMMRAANTTGAVALSGTVRDKHPDNIAERSYRGSCLISRKSPNLMECNMGLRRDIARTYRFDECIAYGGEGDDITRRLADTGAGEVAFVSPAVVHHHHTMGMRGYMRMAERLGRGHARYWYKHDIWVGRDVMPLVAAIATLPLGLVRRRLLLIPAGLAGLQVAAVLWNEVHYKAKPLGESLVVLPASLAYAVVRTGSVLRTLARIATGGEREIRESKQRWRARVGLGTPPTPSRP